MNRQEIYIEDQPTILQIFTMEFDENTKLNYSDLVVVKVRKFQKQIHFLQKTTMGEIKNIKPLNTP